VPTSLEKLTLSWLKPSKLAPTSLKQDSFKRQLHLFLASLTVGSAHRARSVVSEQFSNNKGPLL
jgi:hypothetical protein